MTGTKPESAVTANGREKFSDDDSVSSKVDSGTKTPQATPLQTAPALAAREGQHMEGVLGDAVLRFLRIRKGSKKDIYDLDAASFHSFPQESESDHVVDCNTTQHMGFRACGRI